MCRSCGADFSKWLGRCPSCGEWNTIEEMADAPVRSKTSKPEAFLLSEINSEDHSRMLTGIGEFDLVCGGGMVPGSVILIGGDPGVGKSTLALQVAGRFSSLYISGEESPVQIRHRAERTGIDAAKLRISINTDVEDIIYLIQSEKPECLIVDSIQTLFSSDIPGIVGSVSQIREAASRLSVAARKNGLPVLLIGHITKDGSIAGPKVLEHLVDTVLYFEGDFSRDFRMLRSFKNRFGSVNEMGLFRMSVKGLGEVREKNKLFLNSFSTSSPGNAVSAALEGSRIILFEVQSLVSFSSFSNPRRMADGFDFNRLIIIIAVLEKHAGLKLASFDVFINVSGGFQINETAGDLSVAMAIASSIKEQPVRDGIGFLGEISLSGEVRPVSQCTRRLQEFKHGGYDTVIVSASDLDELKTVDFGGEIIGVSTISEAIGFVF